MKKYILTRLPDEDGKVNWSWKLAEGQIRPYKLITWDWAWIRKEAAKLKVGESKEYWENI